MFYGLSFFADMAIGSLFERRDMGPVGAALVGIVHALPHEGLYLAGYVLVVQGFPYTCSGWGEVCLDIDPVLDGFDHAEGALAAWVGFTTLYTFVDEGLSHVL